MRQFVRADYAGAPGVREQPWLRMDGRRVFRWAMEGVGPAAGVAPAELDVSASVLSCPRR
ncbi:hypothetical protein AB0958_07135 [Streptomyces sp. NPDC006655]|uniref:hypothetical protein n=1 Tax=Streptomyces sp. NPDC006655 TaxID=3156898 RepID=UPI0034546DEB